MTNVDACEISISKLFDMESRNNHFPMSNCIHLILTGEIICARRNDSRRMLGDLHLTYDDPVWEIKSWHSQRLHRDIRKCLIWPTVSWAHPPEACWSQTTPPSHTRSASNMLHSRWPNVYNMPKRIHTRPTWQRHLRRPSFISWEGPGKQVSRIRHLWTHMCLLPICCSYSKTVLRSLD